MITGNDYFAMGIGYFCIALITMTAMLYQKPELVLQKVKKTTGIIIVFVAGGILGMGLNSILNNSQQPWRNLAKLDGSMPLSVQQRLIINQMIEKKTKKILARLDEPQNITVQTIQLINQENDGYANLKLDGNGDPYFELRNSSDQIQGILTFKKKIIHRTGDIVIRPESPLYRAPEKDFNVSVRFGEDGKEQQISN